MDKEKCMSCKHFFQHYTFNGRKILQVYCGHCCGGTRPKNRKPDAPVCEKFFPKQEAEPFVSKEYLSKELLKYVLELELLPEIENGFGNRKTEQV